MKRVEFLILILGSLLFCLPIFIGVSNTFPRLDSDYESNLPVYRYMISFFHNHHLFPVFNPLIATGIPVWGDPLNAFLNPLLSVPLLIFGINLGIRVTIFLCAIGSAFTMWFLLRKYISSSFIIVWGALLYASSGTFVAQIASGHIEKFLVFPTIPVFFLLSLESKYSLKNVILTGLIIAFATYSGDFYAVWFFFIFAACIQTFYLLLSQETFLQRSIYLVADGFFFLIFSLPKLCLLITQVMPIMRRIVNIDPFVGSLHVWILPFLFILPFQTSFYENSFFQQNFGFAYHWYEYYFFLGFFPLIFLKNLGKVIKERSVQLMIFLLSVGAFYLACGFVYSPFHYLFLVVKNIEFVRVSSRIGIGLTAVIVLFLCMLADTWKNKKTLIPVCIISLMCTFALGWYTFSSTFVTLPKEAQEAVNVIEGSNPEHLPTVTLVAHTQYFLLQKNIPVVNYYYGWLPKNTPAILSDEGSLQKNVLSHAHASFILAPLTLDFRDIGYIMLYTDLENAVWKKK